MKRREFIALFRAQRLTWQSHPPQPASPQQNQFDSRLAYDANSSSSAFASFRSRVSNPSVNHA